MGYNLPFYEFEKKTFSMSMQKAESLRYNVEDLNDWIWGGLDRYIQKALGGKKVIVKAFIISINDKIKDFLI